MAAEHDRLSENTYTDLYAFPDSDRITRLHRPEEYGITRLYSRHLGYPVAGDHSYDIIAIYYAVTPTQSYFCNASSLGGYYLEKDAPILTLLLQMLNETLALRLTHAPKLFFASEQTPLDYFSPLGLTLAMAVDTYTKETEDLFLHALSLFHTLIDAVTFAYPEGETFALLKAILRERIS